MLCPGTFGLNIIINKNLSFFKLHFAAPNLKTWLRTCNGLFAFKLGFKVHSTLHEVQLKPNTEYNPLGGEHADEFGFK